MATTGIVQRYGTKAELSTENGGADRPRQGELVFATDTGEFGYLDATSDLIWIDFLEYYKKDEYVTTGGDASDEGSPVILNSEGYIDSTMLKTTAFVLIDNFTPVTGAGLEYPDATGEAIGSFWLIDGVDIAGFTYSYGDLIGEIIYNGDSMLWADQGWLINRGAINPEAYYKLDGTTAVTFDFNGGGFKITNITDGVLDSDGVSIAQHKTKFDGLVASGNMVVESTSAFKSVDNENILSYVYSDVADPLFPSTSLMEVGEVGIGVNINAVIFSPVQLKNAVSIKGYVSDYLTSYDLVGMSVDDKVVIGEGGIQTVIRAIDDLDSPVVRHGVFGSTTDYGIWHEGNLLKNEFAPMVHTHLEGSITDLDKYSQAEVDALLTDKVNEPSLASTANYVLAMDGTNTDTAWVLIDKTYLVLENVDNTSDVNKPVSTAQQTALDLKTDETAFAGHTGNVANPHAVTKLQVGLGSADDTSDANKPVSTATQSALDGKENSLPIDTGLVGYVLATDGFGVRSWSARQALWGSLTGTLSNQTDLQSALDGKVDDAQVLTNVPSGALFTDTVYDHTAVDAHIADVLGNPHAVTKANVGLGSVDDTSDANKPVSTATQAVLDTKFDGLVASGNMVVETTAPIVTSSIENILSYTITGIGDPLFPSTSLIKIGVTGVGIDFDGVMFNPLKVKNDTAVQAYDAGYLAVKNLISRTGVDANTGNNGAYSNEVVVGDADVITALRATSTFDPVVRKGLYGASDDFKIYTEEDFDYTLLATTAQLALKEDSLGNPITDGFILSSTSTGVRSWIVDNNTDEFAIWGQITGTLSGQTDLQNALDAKANLNGDLLEKFQVANGTLDNDAVNLLQVNNALALKEPANANIQTHVTAVTGNPHAVALSQLGDTDMTTTVPIAGDTLQFNGINWVPVTGATGTFQSDGAVETITVTNGLITSIATN